MWHCNAPVGSGMAGIDSLDWVGLSFCEPHPGVVSGSSALTFLYCRFVAEDDIPFQGGYKLALLVRFRKLLRGVVADKTSYLIYALNVTKHSAQGHLTVTKSKHQSVAVLGSF